MAEENHLHPSVGLSDHHVATIGRPCLQGLSDYVAQSFKNQKTNAVMVTYVFQH
jgi:hypothetical protein